MRQRTWVSLFMECRQIQMVLLMETDPAEIRLLKELEAYVFEDMRQYILHFDDVRTGFVRFETLQPGAKAALERALDDMKYKTAHL